MSLISYSAGASIAAGGDPKPTTLPFGATEDHPHVRRFGNVFIRFTSEKQLNDFTAWLSHQAQKPVESLNFGDVLQFAWARGELTSERLVTNNTESLYSFALTTTLSDHVDEFNRNHYFGEEIPKLAQGAGSYYSRDKNWTRTGMALQAALAGLLSTATETYKSNYSNNKLNRFVPTAEQQGLQDLLHHVFGGTQAFDEGHLNVLKMMNLIHGNASSPASTWSLSTEGAAVLRLLQQPNNQAFIPALSMFNLDQADITLANGVRGYFNAKGGFQQGFDVTHVEKVADRILKSLMPPNTPMPTDITLGDRVASTLNFLFGLPANNTRFNVEQVNTAIAIGLIQRNPNNTSQLILTTNGNGYWSAKDAAGKPKDVEQPKPNTPPTPLTRDEQVAAWALALQSFFPGQSAFHLFDGGRDGWKTGAGNNAYRHDSKIGNSDLQALAGRDPTVDKYWTGIFQNLSVADRHRLVALAKYGYENDLFGHMMSQQGPGQRYNGLMHDGFVRGGINIDEFVAGLPSNTPRLHYVTGSNGYVTIQERRP